MIEDLRATYPDAFLRHAFDLSEAHDLSQNAHPDLVILDQNALQEQGVTVFISMLSALAIDWIAIYSNCPNERLPAQRQIQFASLPSFIAQDWRPRTITTGARDAVQPADSRPSPLSDRPSDRLANRHSGKDSATALHHPKPTPAPPEEPRWKPIVIGASTGGIDALIEILSQFPANAPPTLIVQHIKGAFIPGLAERLNRICAPSVQAAKGRDLLKSGRILLAPGNTRHLVVSRDGRSCCFEDGPPQNGHRPSVDRLFSSAAEAWGPKAVGIILSGMGRDGALGLLDMHQCGAWTIGQNKDSSTIYGMPRAAAEIGAVSQEMPLSQIAASALKAASLTAKAGRHPNAQNQNTKAPSNKKTHDA
ncbi:MAG: chemotaxis protein CheB [Pseudomonadota bacterium]